MTHWQLTADILRDIRSDGAAAGSDTVEQRLVGACAIRLPAAGVAIIWTSESASSLVLAATAGAAQELEQIQFTVGEGPQVACTSLRRPVLQPDLHAGTARTWTAFVPEALSRGIGSVFAFPLNVGAINVGVLDIYRHETGHLTDPQLALALAFAEAATTVLLKSNDEGEGGGLPANLDAPFLLQAEVHQATGMISVQAGTDLRTALVMLRGRSFALERPIVDVARDVVARLIRFD